MTTANQYPSLDPSNGIPSHATSAEPEALASGFLPECLSAEDPRYNIRVADQPGTPCALCEAPTGAGPAGTLDEQTVCDRCLLEGCHVLGLLLALEAVVRAYGSLAPGDPERDDALAELGAFARVYERFAARSGPPRTVFPKGGADGPPVH
ncbi:MAG: hypothetical protein GY719_06230 [bacterium]|nr:hypothetical protein [bacterium]